MSYKYLHNVCDTYMNIEMCETENPPVLLDTDQQKVFFNFGKIPHYLIRKQIYDMMVNSKKYLPDGLNFHGIEIYRPMSVQIEYWEKRVNLTKKQYPDVPEEEIIRKSEIFTANPYKEGSGHQTGASIDLTLCNNNGDLLDMGTNWGDGIISKTPTYSTDLTIEQLRNRNILLNAMLRSGFTNYFEEWWHFCYGELEWAVMSRVGKTKFLKIK